MSQIRFQILMRRLNKEVREMKILLNQQQAYIDEAKQLITEFVESKNETKDESLDTSKV